MSEDEGGVSPAGAKQLQIIAGAMASGLALMAGLVVWSYFSAEAKVPEPRDVYLINSLTAILMVAALGAIVASEVVWRSLLKKEGGSLGARIYTGFIVRMALREGASLGGMTAAYIATLNGVLRAYPAYWVNLAPFGLFLVFLATHWPTQEKLESETREVVGEKPSFLKK